MINKNIIYNNKFKLLIFLLLIISSVCWLGKNFLFKNNNLEVEKKFNISQPKNYLQPLVITLGDNILSIAPINAANAQIKNIDNNTVKYLDAYTDTDVEQIKYPNKLKESLILKTANHPDSFEYRIDTQNFDWMLDSGGNIIISSKQATSRAVPSSQGGQISAERMQQYAHEQAKVFKIPKPYMFEETNNNENVGEVKTEIIGDKLILTPDKEWLKNHQYPIVVDPTVEKMPQMVKELAEKRSYNSLTFLNDDGSYTTMAHIGHINYQNTTGSFQSVDTTLRETAGGWIQEKGSYKSLFPKYADEWLEFENMYEDSGTFLKMKPVANHVTGQLVRDKNDEWHDKKVIYADAFGEGNDLELIAGNIALFKYVKLNQKPIDSSQDAEFHFEIELKPGEKLIVDNQEWNGSDEVITSEPIGVMIANGNISYLRKFSVWDKLGQSELIKIKIFRQEGKIYLTKILPKEFLEQATYPVYTDVTISYYAGAGDGGASKQNSADWNTTHNATSGSSASYTDATYIAGVDNDLPTAQKVYRAFFPINTAAIEDDAIITAATFYVYVTGKQDSENDGYDYLAVVGPTTQVSPTALATGDYDTCGAVHDATKGSSNKDLGVVSASAYNSFALNATGIGWISKTDYTKIGMREGHDIDDSEPTGDQTYATLGTSEQSGTDMDPYLSITYNSTPTASSVADTPDPTNPGRSVSFIYDWNDNVGDSVKIKICKTDSLTAQNCNDGYWATSTDFTTNDPATVVYDVVAGDAGQTRNYWAFACDSTGECTTGTAGSFSVNAISTVPNIKVRGGLRVR